MARSTKPRIVRTRLKRLNLSDPFPVLRSRGGVGLGALEKMWHTPAAQIRQWVNDGLLSQQDNGLFSTAEINRFSREHGSCPEHATTPDRRLVRGRGELDSFYLILIDAPSLIAVA